MTERDLQKGKSAGMVILFKESYHACTFPFLLPQRRRRRHLEPDRTASRPLVGRLSSF